MTAPEEDDWLRAAAVLLGLDPWDCVRDAPDQPCGRAGHNLLPCQWERPEEWPYGGPNRPDAPVPGGK